MAEERGQSLQNILKTTYRQLMSTVLPCAFVGEAGDSHTPTSARFVRRELPNLCSASPCPRRATFTRQHAHTSHATSTPQLLLAC